MANKNRNEPPSPELEPPWADTMPERASEPQPAPFASDPVSLAVLTPEPLPAEPAPPEAKPDEPERLTPHTWAEKLGLADKSDPARPWIETHSDWRFAAADKLHGWTDHAHHWQGEGQQLLLTREDFEKALEAGAAYPATPAHGPACGKGFEDRALTKAELDAKAKEKAKGAEVKTNG